MGQKLAAMRVAFKPWRESSSLILVAKTAFAPNATDFNYKLLALKRSSTSAFMPNTYVFPGGNLSSADKSREWLELYAKFGFNSNTFDKLNHKENRTLIFKNESEDVLPKFLSLRIGAIRETFEECGILICRSYKINYKERIARWASFIDGPEIKKWQDKVHDDPQQFLELCHKFEVYPDVWALKEWSNWATPASMTKRFDTVFFLASFLQTPAVHAEKQEVQHLEWGTPKDFIMKNKKEDIMVPPPQYYELSRLNNFKDIDSLSKFANERSECGLERYFPYRINTDNGVYSILPGDDLYPAEIDPTNVDVAFMEKLPESSAQNRILHMSPYSNQILVQNHKPKYNHLVPIELIQSSKL